VIGSSLNADVVLYASPGLAEKLQALGDELRFLLITSGATVVLKADSDNALDIDGERLAVRVTKSPYSKCTRCWHHRHDVGDDVHHPELCGRCVANVDGDGEVRRFV